MLDEPQAQSTPSIPYGQRPPLGFVPRLQVTAAVCLLGTALLPWVTWGLSFQQYAGLGINFSLWQVLVNGDARNMGTTWMYGVGAGMALAAIGSIAEAALRPISTLTRWLTVAGFILAAGSAGLGAVSIISQPPPVPTDSSAAGVTFGIALGLWAGFGLASVGAVLSVVRLAAPPNPIDNPEPFAPSPWGPLPGVVPPGFHPALGPDWVDYIERGEVPPGFVPPSYGPPVYPEPGFVAPAYVAPERHPAQDARISPLTTSDESGSPAPTSGSILVVEGGRSWSFTVRPGEKLLVGRSQDAQIRVSDPRVGARHATIERRDNGWAVQDVDASRPTRLIDPWGSNRAVRGETSVSAGQLVMGGVTVTLGAKRD
jgi:hypothetical protein